jgi:hypothetical protein
MKEYALDLLCDDEVSRYNSQDLLHLDDMVRLGEPSSFKVIGVCMYVCMYVCMDGWMDMQWSPSIHPWTAHHILNSISFDQKILQLLP